MIVERFRDGKTKEIYRRLEELGRQLPEGLIYLDSWVSAEHAVCFQLMQTEDAATLDHWMRKWNDLVDFAIYPVSSSGDFQKDLNETAGQG